MNLFKNILDSELRIFFNGKSTGNMPSSTETHFCNSFTQICACVLILLIWMRT